MNKIDPTAIIGKHVNLGYNNVILPYSIIYDGVCIGNNNVIGSHAVIGCSPTDTKNTELHVDCDFPVCIGDNNQIREFCVVEQPCYERQTVIGNRTFLMQGVHVSHDNWVDDDVVITNQCVLGGIAKILKGADLGMGCTINQYTIVGQYSIVATGAPCMKNVRPFSRYIPNRPVSVNHYAIQKYGFEPYTDEIVGYVMNGITPTSPIIVDIVDTFNRFVSLYGHQTY
ncbi:MAG: hypothetical protein KBT04_05470 [Bacteroidales bacterium]|nr:hypothetical protein [Candidatus Colimorpha onthohippi]